MTEGMFSLLLALGFVATIIAAAVYHKRIRSYILASLAAAAVSTLVVLCGVFAVLLYRWIVWLEPPLMLYDWPAVIGLVVFLGGSAYVLAGLVRLFRLSNRATTRPQEAVSATLFWRRAAKGSAELCTFVLAGAAVFAVVAHAVGQARMAAQRSQCSGHLCGLAIGMHEYLEQNKHWPPAYTEDPSGGRMHSWRVLLLGFTPWSCEARSQPYNLNEPWDSPANRKLAELRPPWYACPSDPETRDNTLTNYFVVVGDKTPFPDARTTSLADIRDDKSHTILITEAVGMDIQWMEPRDLVFDQMSFVPDDPEYVSISSRHHGANARMVDGSAGYLKGLPAETIRAMLTIAGGEQVDLAGQ